MVSRKIRCFNILRSALIVVCCAWQASAAEPRPRYASPGQLQWNPLDQTLTAWETGTDSVCVIDPVRGAIIRRGPRPEANLISPTGFLAGSPDGKWTALIDPWEPRLVIAPVPQERLAETKLADCRLISLGPHATPQALVITPDSRTVLIACDTPGAADRTIAVVTVETGLVQQRTIPGSSNLRGIAVDPQGAYALAVHLRPKSQLPSTQIEQGWVFTNAISYISLTGAEKVVTLPLDLRIQGFANPEGVVFDQQGRWAYVAHAGADVVSVIDLNALKQLAAEVPAATPVEIDAARSGTPIHRGDDFRLTRRYVRTRIPVGANPRGLAIAPDGKTLAVANRLGDSVSIIDTASRHGLRTVSLSEFAPDLVRQGELLFHSGKLAYGGQFSCASCHPDGHTDGLEWDLPADGFNNFHNTKSLLAVAGTQPYGWLGESPTLSERFMGTLRHLFQHEPLEGEAAALEAYLAQLNYPPGLPRRSDPTSAAAVRGKALFEGAAGCAACHRGAQLTDQQLHDVGTGTEQAAAYDTPALLHVVETAPYLHDGRARTLAEIFQTHNGNRMHGRAADLSAEQLAELIEYLKGL